MNARYGRYIVRAPLLQVLVQLLLLGEGYGVDTLEHLAVRVAAPVGAAALGQLDGVALDAALCHVFSGAGAAVWVERKEYAVCAVRLPAGRAFMRGAVVRVRSAASARPGAGGRVLPCAGMGDRQIGRAHV